MEIRIQVQGLREIQARMRELPKRIDKKILDGGLLAGARIVRDEAQARAPELKTQDPRWQRGALKRAIRAARIRPSEYSAEVVVSVRKLTARQVTRAKDRLAKRGQRLATKSGGRGFEAVPGDAFYWFWVEFGRAGMPAQPFLRPAFEARKDKAVEEAIKFFRDRVQLEIEKLGRTVNN